MGCCVSRRKNTADSILKETPLPPIVSTEQQTPLPLKVPTLPPLPLKETPLPPLPLKETPLSPSPLKIAQSPLQSRFIKPFSFDGEYKAYVSRVIDGDTIVANFAFRGEISAFNIRIYGIDTPEMHPKKKGLTDIEITEIKQNAIFAKRALELEILNEYVLLIVNGLRDKYGRVLAKVYVRNTDITKYMIECGYGVAYYGKKKTLKGN